MLLPAQSENGNLNFSAQEKEEYLSTCADFLTGKITPPLDACAVAALADDPNCAVTLSLECGSDTFTRTLTTSGWEVAPVKLCVMTKLWPLIILFWLIG